MSNYLDVLNVFIVVLASGSEGQKVVLFPEIGRVKIVLSLTRSHSRMCIRIYIFNFKKQTNKQKKNNINTNKANFRPPG